MKYVYVLEDDEKFRNEIIDAIHTIDRQLGVRCFDTVESFGKWVEIFLVEGPAAIAKGGSGTDTLSTSENHQLVLIVTKNNLLGVKHLSLLHKTRALLLKKEACTLENPTSIILTCFGGPEFNLRLAGDPIINNVIFKPFDKLILQQHLAFAIQGRRPPSQYFIHNMKTSSTIEMLTDVEIEAISDVGLIIISNHTLKVGQVFKFYSPVFNSLRHRSLLGLCRQCTPHPQKPGHFRCAFTYLSADPFQITSIRKEVRKKELPSYPFDWSLESRGNQIELALISSDDSLMLGFKDYLQKNFTNVKLHLYTQVLGYLKALTPHSPKQPAELKNLSAVFMDQALFEGNLEQNWKNLTEATMKILNDHGAVFSRAIEFFAFTAKKLPDKNERILGNFVKDIFYFPIDPIYLLKKLKIFLPQLRPYENVKIPTVAHPHHAKIGLPVEVIEFSEAGLVFKFNRPNEIGTLREFVLWIPHEFDFPEFIAACNYCEESSSEKGLFLNYFVFFGVNDHYLKHLRRWILQNHVLNKESSADS